jgi:hypothetical protein
LKGEERSLHNDYLATTRVALQGDVSVNSILPDSSYQSLQNSMLLKKMNENACLTARRKPQPLIVGKIVLGYGEKKGFIDQIIITLRS